MPAITQPTRYAIRQVLDQELYKHKILLASQARQARGNGLPTISSTHLITDADKENIQPSTTSNPNPQVQTSTKIARDFFGRPIAQPAGLEVDTSISKKKLDASSIAKSTAMKGKAQGDGNESEGGRIWVSFNEGFSNAVRKPITLTDLMEGF